MRTAHRLRSRALAALVLGGLASSLLVAKAADLKVRGSIADLAGGGLAASQLPAPPAAGALESELR